MSDIETCPTCRRFTERGRQHYHEQHKPIYGVDFSKSKSQLVAEVRKQLTEARGQLWDVGFRYTGWTAQLNDVEGLLTCALIVLHNIKEAMEEHDRRPSEECGGVVGSPKQ